MKQELYGDNSHSVLVVDDDHAMRKLVRRNLETEDLQVLEAADGFGCLSTLSERRVDLVLLDVRLPDLNGWGILGLIRMTDSLCHIPVILFTAEEPNPTLREQFKPDDYIQKPFDVSDLLERVKEVLHSKRTNRYKAEKADALTHQWKG